MGWATVRFEVRIPRVTNFRLLHIVQTGSVVHRANFPVDTGALLLGVEGGKTLQLNTHSDIVPTLKIVGLYIHGLNASCLTNLSTGEAFVLHSLLPLFHRLTPKPEHSHSVYRPSYKLLSRGSRALMERCLICG
jgi:hypothetical protein